MGLVFCGKLGRGQPKQAKTEIGRNRNKCLRKAEFLAETEALAETFFSAEHRFG